MSRNEAGVAGAIVGAIFWFFTENDSEKSTKEKLKDIAEFTLIGASTGIALYETLDEECYNEMVDLSVIEDMGLR